MTLPNPIVQRDLNLLAGETSILQREQLSVRRRYVVTASRTYYVRADGSNANSGLENTAAGAFLTIQYAVDYVARSLDIVSGQVTIQVADGTYTITSTIVLPPHLSNSAIVIQGNVATPSNVVLNFTTSNGNGLSADNPRALYAFQGFRLTGTTGTTNYALSASNGARLSFSALEFNTGWFLHLYATNGGSLTASGNYSVLGAAGYHWVAQLGGSITVVSRTLTITAALAFTGWALVTELSYVYCASCTFTNGGTVTGTRYFLNTNSVIQTAGAAATYLPGNVNGTPVTGGQYV